MPTQKPSETWSAKMAALQACGLGVFAGGYVGVQAGLTLGIGAAVITTVVVLAFAWFMRMREDKKAQDVVLRGLRE